MLLITCSLVPFNAGGLSKPSWYEWDISTEDAVIRADMIVSGESDVDAIGGTNSTERTDASYYITIVYNKLNCDGENMFTPETVKAMCETDAVVYNNGGWKGTGVAGSDARGYCLLSDGECEQPVSPSNLFYGSNHNFTCELLSDSEVSDASAALYSHLQTTSGELAYGFFVDKGAPSDGQTCRTRSMFKVGSPLRGYAGASTVGDEQYYSIQEFMMDVQDDLHDFFGMDAEGVQALIGRPANLGGVARKGGLDVSWFSLVMQNGEMTHVVSNDTKMALASIFFVWFWIVVHTGSLWVGSLGMLQIILSLPVSLFLYRVVFQIWFFDTLQTLAIFVILGVGADDVFVMVDAWVQSRDEVPYDPRSEEGEEDDDPRTCDPQAFPACCVSARAPHEGHDPARAGWYARRMEYAYSRAAKAVFNTSWTTAMVFFATAVSPIMPISTFGIYAAICIIMNYIFVMTLTPAAIIIQEYYLEGTYGEKRSSLATCCCWIGCFKLSFKPNFGPFGESAKGWTPPPALAVETVSTDEDCEGATDDSTRWCSPEGIINGYVGMMERKTEGGVRRLALGTVLALTAYGVFSCAAASQLTPPTEAEQWFPDDHIYSKALGSMDRFLSGDDDSYALFKVRVPRTNVGTGLP